MSVLPLLVAATACGPFLCAQGPLQASLTALQPIIAAGSAGAPVAWPPGPLTSATVTGPQGVAHAEFVCVLQASGEHVEFDALSVVAAPGLFTASTFADLLLTVDASVAPVAALVEVEIQHWGDLPAGSGMVVDVGNDGTTELATLTAACCGTTWRHGSGWESGNGPLQVRIQSFNAQFGGPQAYLVSVRVRPCVAGIGFVAPACPRIGFLASPAAAYYSNYALAPLPAAAPHRCEFVATGVGNLSIYVVSDQSGAWPLALPLPFTGTCDVFVSVIATVPGVPVAQAGPIGAEQPVAWSLMVPPLPPGLTFWVQHLSATWGAPGREVWGASNRVRYDT